jgi:hypothetical protein
VALDPHFKEISPDRIGAVNPVGEGGKQLPSSTQSFESFMKPGEAGAAPGKLPMQSPFDILPHGQTLATTPTFDTVLNQAKAATSTLGDIQTQLTTPNLKINQGRKYLLKNKLTEANAHLHAANAKMGVEIAPKGDEETPTGPLGKFIKLVTDGQQQLEAAKQQLHQMKDKGEALSPGDLLLIQLKVNTAQQNLEFSSMILSKAVEDTKLLLQTQL